jgi:hypothetical protein
MTDFQNYCCDSLANTVTVNDNVTDNIHSIYDENEILNPRNTVNLNALFDETLDSVIDNDNRSNDTIENVHVLQNEITNEPDVSIMNSRLTDYAENIDVSLNEIIVEEPDVSILSDDRVAEDVNIVEMRNENVDRTEIEINVNDQRNSVENEIENIRCKYRNNMIVSHLNVNSLNLKFNEVHDLIVRSKFEVIVLSETKLDESYQNALYEIESYNMYRQDKRSNSGGMMIYVSKNLPSTNGNINNCNDDIECMSVEISLNETKLLLVGMYKNPKMSPNSFKLYFEKTCEEVLEKYENVIITGDLNFNMLKDNLLAQICPTYNLTNIIKEPTCFKSNNATLIDVMLVTKRRKFLKGFSFDTGISDFHNLIGGVLKQHAPIPLKKKVTYRKLEEIDYDKVNQELNMMNLFDNIMENDANDAFNILHKSLTELLDKHAPRKSKIVRKNDFHCMSKRLKKAILVRNQMRNKFFKYRTNNHLAQYRKHRNTVTLIKREEIKKYFQEKCKGSTKNKDFWKAVKPIFSKSKTKSDNIPLHDNGEIITDCNKVCEIFNSFFSKIGSDIGYPEDNHKPTEEIIAGYANHPSVIMIKDKINPAANNIDLCEVTERDVRKIISKLSSKKASGYDEIPVKFVKMISRSLLAPMTKIANKCIQ